MDDCESLSHSKWECKYHVVSVDFGVSRIVVPAMFSAPTLATSKCCLQGISCSSAQRLQSDMCFRFRSFFTPKRPGT